MGSGGGEQWSRVGRTLGRKRRVFRERNGFFDRMRLKKGLGAIRSEGGGIMIS